MKRARCELRRGIYCGANASRCESVKFEDCTNFRRVFKMGCAYRRTEEKRYTADGTHGRAVSGYYSYDAETGKHYLGEWTDNVELYDNGDSTITRSFICEEIIPETLKAVENVETKKE